MSYAERAFAGPDYWGRTFQAEPCQHCADRDEHNRFARLREAVDRAIRERRSVRRWAA